jgi:hypothetical protein
MFKKGMTRTGGRLPGVKNKRTLIKEAIGFSNMEDAKQICLKNFEYFLNHKDDMIRLQATKEVSKYLFATKKDLNIGLNETELEYLRQMAGEQMKKHL